MRDKFVGLVSNNKHKVLSTPWGTGAAKPLRKFT